MSEETLRVIIYKDKKGRIILAPFDGLAFRISNGYLVFRYTVLREEELREYEKEHLTEVTAPLSTRTKEEIFKILSDPQRDSYFYFSATYGENEDNPDNYFG
jgi:hypothetical protein